MPVTPGFAPTCTPVPLPGIGQPAVDPRATPDCAGRAEQFKCAGSGNQGNGDPVCFNCFEDAKDYFISKYFAPQVQDYVRNCVTFAAIGDANAYGDFWTCYPEYYGGSRFIQACEVGGGYTFAWDKVIQIGGAQTESFVHEMGHIFEWWPWTFTCGGARGSYFQSDPPDKVVPGASFPRNDFPRLHELVDKWLARFRSDPTNPDLQRYRAFYEYLSCQYAVMQDRRSPDYTHFAHLYASIASWTMSRHIGGSLAGLPPEFQAFYSGWLKGAQGSIAPCTEDVDHDGCITQADLDRVNQHFGCKIGDACYDATADVDGDGKIDAQDRYLVTRELELPGLNGCRKAQPDYSALACDRRPTSTPTPTPARSAPALRAQVSGSTTELPSQLGYGCPQAYAVFASTSIQTRSDNAWAKGYPLAPIAASQPFISGSEFGKLLPGNLEIMAYYTTPGRGSAGQVPAELRLTVYPLTGTVEANALAWQYPPHITFNNQIPAHSLCGGTYQEYYEVWVTLPKGVVIDESLPVYPPDEDDDPGQPTATPEPAVSVYLPADGLSIGVFPVTGNVFAGVMAGSCQLAHGSDAYAYPAFIPACPARAGLTSILLDQ